MYTTTLSNRPISTPRPLLERRNDKPPHAQHLCREEYNSRFDWPPDSPVAEVYDVQNTPAKMVLLNNRTKPRSASHLRGQTDRVDLRATTPNPERHSQDSKRNADRHVRCSDNSSPRFTRNKQKDNMWVSSSARTRKSSGDSSTLSRASSRASSEHSDDKNERVRARRSSGHSSYSVSPAYFTAPKCGIPKKQRKPPISMQDNTNLVQNLSKGNKAYLWSIAQVYDVSKEKQYKQHQYKALVLKEVLRGFHSMEECRKYLNYLDGPRQRPYGSTDPSRKPTNSPRGTPRRSKSATRQRKKTDKRDASESDKTTDKDERSITSSKSSRRSSRLSDRVSDHEEETKGDSEVDSETESPRSGTEKSESESHNMRIDVNYKNRKTSTNKDRSVSAKSHKGKEQHTKTKQSPYKSRDAQVKSSTRSGLVKKENTKSKINKRKDENEKQHEEETPREEKPTEIKVEIKLKKKQKSVAPVGNTRRDDKTKAKDGQSTEKSFEKKSEKKTYNAKTKEIRNEEAAPNQGNTESSDSDCIELKGPEGTTRPKSRLGSRVQATSDGHNTDSGQAFECKESISEPQSVQNDGSRLEEPRDDVEAAPESTKAKNIFSETDSEDDTNGNNKKYPRQNLRRKDSSDAGSPRPADSSVEESDSDSEFPMKYDTKLDARFTIQPRIDEERQSQTQLEVSKNDSTDEDINGNSPRNQLQPQEQEPKIPTVCSKNIDDDVVELERTTTSESETDKGKVEVDDITQPEHTTTLESDVNKGEVEVDRKSPVEPVAEDVEKSSEHEYSPIHDAQVSVGDNRPDSASSAEEKRAKEHSDDKIPMGDDKLVLYIKSANVGDSGATNEESVEDDQHELREDYNISAEVPSDNDQDLSGNSDSDKESKSLNGPEGTTRPKSRLGNRPLSSKMIQNDSGPAVEEKSSTEPLVEGEYITLETDSINERIQLQQTEEVEKPRDTGVLVSDTGNRLTEDAEPLSVSQDEDLTNQLETAERFDDDVTVNEHSEGRRNSSNDSDTEQHPEVQSRGNRIDRMWDKVESDDGSQGQRKNSLNLLRSFLDAEAPATPDSARSESETDVPSQDEPQIDITQDKVGFTEVPHTTKPDEKSLDTDTAKEHREQLSTSEHENEDNSSDSEQTFAMDKDCKDAVNDNEGLVETKTRKLSVDSSSSSSSEETMGRAGLLD